MHAGCDQVRCTLLLNRIAAPPPSQGGTVGAVFVHHQARAVLRPLRAEPEQIRTRSTARQPQGLPKRLILVPRSLGTGARRDQILHVPVAVVRHKVHSRSRPTAQPHPQRTAHTARFVQRAATFKAPHVAAEECVVHRIPVFNAAPTTLQNLQVLCRHPRAVGMQQKRLTHHTPHWITGPLDPTLQGIRRICCYAHTVPVTFVTHCSLLPPCRTALVPLPTTGAGLKYSLLQYAVIQFSRTIFIAAA